MTASSRREFLLGPLRRLRGQESGGADDVPPEEPAREVTAMLDPRRCLNGRGLVCTVCAERCPVEGAMRLMEGRPLVDPRACTGCGVCADVCPAPEPAIRLVPAKTRGAA